MNPMSTSTQAPAVSTQDGGKRSTLFSRMNASYSLWVVCIVSALSIAGCKAGTDDADTVQTEVTVKTAKISQVTLHAYAEAYGMVEPEPAGDNKPAGVAQLAAPLAGIVISVPVKEGDHVSAGTVIVKLDDRAALAAVNQATHALEMASQAMARQNKLKAIDGTSEKTMQQTAQQLADALAQLQTAKTQLAQVHLTTPVSGIVAHIFVHPGQVVDPTIVAAEVVDPTRLVITASIATSDAMNLKSGSIADIFVDGGDHPATIGKVLFVSPITDAKSDGVLVRLSVPALSALRAGQTVRTRIITEEHTNSLAVPTASVVTDAAGNSFIALVNGDTATQKSVRVGIHDGDWIEVAAEGLKPGDTVVTVGAYGLPAQTKIRVSAP